MYSTNRRRDGRHITMILVTFERLYITYYPNNHVWHSNVIFQFSAHSHSNEKCFIASISNVGILHRLRRFCPPCHWLVGGVHRFSESITRTLVRQHSIVLVICMLLFKICTTELSIFHAKRYIMLLHSLSTIHITQTDFRIWKQPLNAFDATTKHSHSDSNATQWYAFVSKSDIKIK